MHHGGDVSAQADPAGELPAVERNVAREAARWLLRLSSERATDADVHACAQWRASKAEHEHAWQRAQRVNARFGLIPSALGMAALNRPDLKSRRAAVKTLIALIVAGPAGWAAWRADPLDWRADYRSAAGERRDVMLADGSTLHLNTSSAVDVLFDDATRLLRLRGGEIAVHAVADPASHPRPFIVRTRLGDIEAQASRFCVRQEGGRCQLSVQEGRVRVATSGQPGHYVDVSAGEQSQLSPGAVAVATPADPHASDWLRGVLYASALRLDAFAAELGRYRQGIVRCDPDIAHLRISGAFQLHDTDAVLAALPATLPVQVRYRTPYWVTILPRDAAA
ncbi:FecR domain-containing protein [Achromobacter mucicolens]|uniref:Protein FecR n=1 Tax=Achromobacter mucicolens TaxID=1389922 RepID=A0ABM8L9E2_9BURK|nr:FecR domain-containing protein [Achromobacter mucicolens]MCP2515038.1 FecR domain-containing protein [Achromobacter mucicolens]CAB3836573.1 Protein FecR [Achromobacter mucicolens]